MVAVVKVENGQVCQEQLEMSPNMHVASLDEYERLLGSPEVTFVMRWSDGDTDVVAMSAKCDEGQMCAGSLPKPFDSAMPVRMLLVKLREIPDDVEPVDFSLDDFRVWLQTQQ